MENAAMAEKEDTIVEALYKSTFVDLAPLTILGADMGPRRDMHVRPCGGWVSRLLKTAVRTR
jgi:hypothetical protein